MMGETTPSKLGHLVSSAPRGQTELGSGIRRRRKIVNGVELSLDVFDSSERNGHEKTRL